MVRIFQDPLACLQVARGPQDYEVVDYIALRYGYLKEGRDDAHLFALVNPYAASGYFGQYKMKQKTWRMTETLAYYVYSSVSTRGFNGFQSSCLLVQWMKEASALERLSHSKLWTLHM